MDEPLSNLDAKQRVTMRSEIIAIHKDVGATTIYVTHDQTEAMTMADRIVVMKDGRVQQIGTPHDLYFKPVNMFVAGFIGEPPMNFVTGRAENGEFVFGGVRLDISKSLGRAADLEGKELVMGFRPEHVVLSSDHVKGYVLRAFVELKELLGDNTNVYAKIGEDVPVILKVDPHEAPSEDAETEFTIPFDKTYWFDKATEEVLR